MLRCLVHSLKGFSSALQTAWSYIRVLTWSGAAREHYAHEIGDHAESCPGIALTGVVRKRYGVMLTYVHAI